MKHLAGIIFFISLTALLSAPLFSLTIKMGSPAPEGSPWDNALKKISSEWRAASGGKIDLKIYPGGIVGNEADMVRKMRIGQLQAAVFTSMGMSYITPEVISLSLPFLVHNDKELEYLMNKTRQEFESLIDKKGFIVVTWSKVGWLNFFSTKPVLYPRDLKQLKLSVADSEPQLLQAWRVMGYNALPLPTTDVMISLQNGMVEAIYTTPLVAASFQWFGIANNMCALRISPMIGGFVVTKKTWKEIPGDIQPKLVKIARQVVEELYPETITLEKKAIDTMKKHGLKIHEVPPDAIKAWEKEARDGYDVYVGKTFSRDLLEKIRKYLKEYRDK